MDEHIEEMRELNMDVDTLGIVAKSIRDATASGRFVNWRIQDLIEAREKLNDAIALLEKTAAAHNCPQCGIPNPDHYDMDGCRDPDCPESY